MRNLVEMFKAARRVSVPALAISTPDQRVLAKILAEAVNGEAPKVTWDAVRGLRGMNDQGEAALSRFEEDPPGSISRNPMEAIAMIEELPEKTIVFWLNAHRTLDDPIVVQGVQNLRDIYKADRRMLVLLAPSFNLPPELAGDVVLLDDPLPNDEELGEVLSETYQNAGLDLPDEQTKRRAIDAARGLPAFGAETIYAMSFKKESESIFMDLEDAWERKRTAVNMTKGLKMAKLKRPETFDILGGLDEAKKFARRRVNGKEPPGAILFIDEIDKSMAGATGPVSDSSGVSADQHGTLLKTMEDNDWDGVICAGPPGSGKTAWARAFSATFELPHIEMDLGGFKGQFVGNSEQAIRDAMKVVQGIAGKNVFVVATCNKMDNLSPELRRRFKVGVFYFDLPTVEERASIWDICIKKYNLTEEQIADRPNDTDWTGAEIRNCCDLAWRLDCTLQEASAYVVPVAKADPRSIETIRNAAKNRWLSASYPGTYDMKLTGGSSSASTSRAITVE